MNTRFLAIISLACLIGTTCWIILMIVGGSSPETFEAILARVSRLDAFYYLTYLNAAFLITIPVTMLMAALYVYCKPYLPEWAALVGMVFVPVYCVLNLFAYLSQITVIPLLVRLYQQTDSRAMAEVLLRLTIQQLPGSEVSFFNGLAYALLGIPSIIFGIALLRGDDRLLKTGGVLLALNGVACILGVIGDLSNLTLLRLGGVIGGVLFFFALIFMVWSFFTVKYQKQREYKHESPV